MEGQFFSLRRVARRPRRNANPDPPAETCFRRCRPIRELGFAIQVFLEAHVAPILLLGRWLVTGHAYRRIPLTQGRFARVDPEDYAELAKYKWCASRESGPMAFRCPKRYNRRIGSTGNPARAPGGDL